jgi:hypothetical protein
VAKLNRISIRELRRLLPIWQEILRIQDWDIKVEVVKDIPTFEEAYVNHDYIYKTAKITFRLYTTWETEQILVHELLHVAMSGFDGSIVDDSTEDILLETFVDHTAKALVRMHNGA